MKTRRHFASRFVFGGLLILAVAQPGFSQGFEFTIAPYVLIPSMTGEVTLRGRPVEVDVGPGDILENLDELHRSAEVESALTARLRGLAFVVVVARGALLAEFSGSIAELDDGVDPPGLGRLRGLE